MFVCLSRMRSYTIHPIVMKPRWVVVRTPAKVYELLFLLLNIKYFFAPKH
jgi:hypothetical protein